MRFPKFCGPSYTLRTIPYDCQRCVNWFPEVDELFTGKDNEIKQLLPTPGLTLAGNLSLTGDSIRGLYTTSTGLCFCVAGNTLYQLSDTPPNVKAIVIGNLNTSNGPINATMFADNGTYLMFCDNGGYGYSYDFANGGNFTELTFQANPGFLGAGSVNYYDGYFICNQPGTNIFFWSDIEQPTFTNALSFDSKSGYPDPIAGIVVINRNLWLIGTQTTEIWYDQPSGNTVFQRIQGPFIESGCVDGNTIQKTEAGAYWVSQNLRGGAWAVVTNGYNVQSISTQAQQLAWQSYGSLVGSTSFVYQEDGHLFYVINLPNSNTQWVYDNTTSQILGVPTWHERTYTQSDGTIGRALPDCHAYYQTYHLVGDYSSPNIYYYDYKNYTDNGAVITRDRVAPHISSDMVRLFYNMFQVDGNFGTGTETRPAVTSGTGSVTYTAEQGQTAPGGDVLVGYADPFFATVQNSLTPIYQAFGVLSDNTLLQYNDNPIAIFNDTSNDTFNIIIASTVPVPYNLFYSAGGLLASNAIIKDIFDFPSGMYQTYWQWQNVSQSYGFMTPNTSIETIFYLPK
jgi:hypothetical protein